MSEKKGLLPVVMHEDVDAYVAVLRVEQEGRYEDRYSIIQHVNHRVLNVLNDISNESPSYHTTLVLGMTVYELLDRKGDLPFVGVGTCERILTEARHANYVGETLKRLLEEDNEAIGGLIVAAMSRSTSWECAGAAGILVYGLLEKQVEIELEKQHPKTWLQRHQLTMAQVEKKFVDVALLSAEIEYLEKA